MPESKKNKKKTPWFIISGILVPIIIMLISIFATRVLTEKKKSIALEVYSNEQLFTIEKRIKTRLKDIDIEKFLDKLNFMTFRIINDGKKGIIGTTDLAKSIEIIFPDDYRIIGKPEIVENPHEVEVRFEECEENEIKLWFDLLNSHQYFTMDVFYIGGPPINPNLKTKIVDLDKKDVRNLIPTSEEKPELIFQTANMIFTFTLLLVFALMAFRYTLYRTRYRTGKKNIEAMLKITSYAYLIMLIYFIIKNYYRFIKLLDIPLNFTNIFTIIMPLIFVLYIGFFITIIFRRFKKLEKTKLSLKELESKK